MNSKFSVIIPCFNGDDFLKDSIESVLKQTHKVEEIIVVDDGSTDSTKQIALSFPEVRYFYHDNQGVSFSRNRGISECLGEYVIFLDADDLLPQDRVKEDCRFLDENKEVGYVFGWVDVIDEKGIRKELTKPKNIIDAGYPTILEGHATVPPGAVTFRVAYLRRLDIVFDANICAAEDFDLYLRFSRIYPIYCHNRIALYYRRHQSNLSASNGGINTLRSMLERLNEQNEYVRNSKGLSRSLSNGRKHWKKLLGPRCVGQIVMAMKDRRWKASVGMIISLFRLCPFVFMASLIQRVVKRI